MANQDFLKRLREIDLEVYKNMHKTSQIVIDMVQDNMVNLQRDVTCEEPVTKDDLGALSYDIENLLEVYNPTLEYDIDVLKRFNQTIEEWYNSLTL